MQRRLMLVIVAVYVSAFSTAALRHTFAAPGTQPTTSSSAGTSSLLSGDITFVPPPSTNGWQQAGHSTNERMIAYAQNAPNVAIKSVLAVNADLQQQVLRDDDAMPIGQMISKRIRDNAKGGTEIIDAPTIEKDERFFLRIHHRFRKAGKVGDSLQLYRVMGLNLVSVAVTAYTESPDDAKPVFAIAEQVMLSAKDMKAASNAEKPAKPITLAEEPTTLSSAKLSLKAPTDWKFETGGEDHGIVAKFHDPLDNTNLIAVSVRPLPPEAKKDPKIRDAMVDQIVAGEKTDFSIEGATVVGSTVDVVDRRFLRKTKTKLNAQGTRFDVSSRQIRVGDAIVSVTVVCLNDQFARIDKAADEMAVSLKSTSQR